VNDDHRPMLVEGTIAKAHLFLYLLGRFDEVWLEVDASRCEPADIPHVLLYDIRLPTETPLSVSPGGVEGEVTDRGRPLPVRVPWDAVYLITAGGIDYHVDDPPAGRPPPLTVIRGGKA